MNPGKSAPDEGDRAIGWAVWSVVAAFGAYFCAYAYRKPFTAATYDGRSLGGLDLKTALVVSQVLGYTLSKFLGVPFVSGLHPSKRAGAIVGLILFALAALGLFAVAPPAWKPVCLFLNGLPLGMVFGLVLGFLEGRRLTEALAAGLCASFIVADGATRSVGAKLLAAGVSESAMPALAGLIFLAPAVLFAAMLSRIPPPTPADVARRRERPPMSRDDRARFLRAEAPGLIPLIAVYLMLTLLRSVRADFAPEIWRSLGWSNRPDVFATSETVVALLVLAIAAATALPRDNRTAFRLALAMSGIGLLTILAANPLRSAGALSAFPYMVLVGFGLYLPYVLFHTTILERLVALARDPGNLAYLMFLADAFGYLGYAGLVLIRVCGGFGDHAPAGDPDARFFELFQGLAFAVPIAGVALLALASRHYARRLDRSAARARPEGDA